jgi:hypothetical protein
MTQRADKWIPIPSEGFVMTLQLASRMRFFHERYFGRPSCPKCGELMMAPESSEYVGGHDIRHSWMCDECAYPFNTLIRFDGTGA